MCVYVLKPEAALLKIALIKDKPKLFTITIVYSMDVRHFCMDMGILKRTDREKTAWKKKLWSSVNVTSSQLTYHLALTSK